jgi:hypothetical protein
VIAVNIGTPLLTREQLSSFIGIAEQSINILTEQNVRAQLALQGIESKVQRVSVDNDTWHRVRVGPIVSLDELNRTRTRLRQAEIDALVIRVGD